MSERKNNSIMNSTLARKRLVVVSAAGLLCTSLSCSLTQAQEPLRETLREETARQSDLSRIFQEPAEPLTMAAAIRLALESNPTIAAARREIEATEAQVLQGSLRPNPGFSVATENASRVSRSASAQVELPIERGDKRAARVDAAQRGRDVAVSDLSGRQLKVRAAVMAAFFDVLAAQELLALAQDSAALARRATDIAAKRVAAGKVSPVEETKARVAEAGVRVSLTQAQSELRNARRRLASWWGNPSPRFSEALGDVDRMPSLPDPDAIEQRLSTSPLLERARLELERRKSLVNVEQSKTVQDFTVSVGVQRREESQREQMMVGISVPIPLYNRNQGNLLEALRREDKARDELVATRITLASEAYQVVERLSARRQEAELLRDEVLPGAQSAYEAATIGFENGKFSFLEVLDAQRTFFSAKSQYLNALAALHRAVTDLESILGQSESGASSPSPSAENR
jgi:cobalt-zinc-cadmium efflux system outer membrane protein